MKKKQKKKCSNCKNKHAKKHKIIFQKKMQKKSMWGVFYPLFQPNVLKKFETNGERD